MAPVPTSDLRFLVRDQLTEVTTRLNTYWNALVPDKQDFLQQAFETPEQIDRFAPTIEQLASVAACAEMHRLARSRILFQQLPENDTELAAAFSLDNINAALDPGAPVFDAHAGVTKQAAYERYLHWVLGTRRSLAERVDYRQNFYHRNPIAQRIIELKCDFFVESICEACNRIYDDRGALQQVFFDGNPARLLDIATTGSDSHKRGRQVLILTFDHHGNEFKLVYKPSDVEIDFRIMASGDGPLKVFLDNNGGNGRYPLWTESLSTLINRHLETLNHEIINSVGHPPMLGPVAELHRNQLKLPTYRILPCNPGSRTDADAANLPTEQAYGYVEFLSNNPPVNLALQNRITERLTLNDLGRLMIDALMEQIVELRNTDPGRLANSDWVTDERLFIRWFCRSWGRVMGMAFLVGTTDLHDENQLVHRKRPTLIDLEHSFDQVTRLQDSLLAESYNYTITSESTFSLWQTEPLNLDYIRDLPAGHARYTNIGFDDLAYTPLVWVDFSIPKAATNALFFFPADHAQPTHADPLISFNHRETMRGIKDVFGLARDPNSSQDLRQFLRQCRNLVTRHVPESTAVYADFLWHGYEQMLLDGVGLDADTAVAHNDAIQTQAEAKIIAGREDWEQPDRLNRPVFTLESPNNNWRDYLNFDVPFYYRRLGQDSGHIYNSQGQRVDLAAAINFQNGRYGLAGLIRNVNQFFPHAMPTYFIGIFNILAGSNDQEFRRAVKDLLIELIESKKPYLVPVDPVLRRHLWLPGLEQLRFLFT